MAIFAQRAFWTLRPGGVKVHAGAPVIECEMVEEDFKEMAAAGVNIYIFWDDVHPTTHIQAVLGQEFAQALGVPEPSEMALLVIGLLALVTLVPRRKRG